MTDYSIILISTIIIPFIFSFEKKVNFISKIKTVLKVIFIVFIPYIIWDIVFTNYSVWGFSEEKVSRLKILSLPIEEHLFFFCIPYTLIFIYEVINFYLIDSKLKFNHNFALLFGIILLTIAIITYPKAYTSLQFLITSILSFYIWLKKLEIFLSKNFWIFIIVSFIGFIVINYFLTSIPIVVYNSSQILGIRILTIPVEDFFYHFTLTTVLIILYKSFHRLNEK
ncbi:MAG: lycopene cyclase domain-containing protein [Candidatus Omnitrophica bacterium]|nr:lycopene cyclase domain-containing protein [Candidatus Omnitrophota bacterium]